MELSPNRAAKRKDLYPVEVLMTKHSLCGGMVIFTILWQTYFTRGLYQGSHNTDHIINFLYIINNH